MSKFLENVCLKYQSILEGKYNLELKAVDQEAMVMFLLRGIGKKNICLKTITEGQETAPKTTQLEGSLKAHRLEGMLKSQNTSSVRERSSRESLTTFVIGA